MPELATILATLKVGYNFGNLGYKGINKALKMIDKKHPAYKEIDKLYDIIANMKDAINLAKDQYFELSIEKRELQEKLDQLNEWEEETKGALKKVVSPGAQVVINKNEKNVDLFHTTWYCPGCHAKKQIGVMQYAGKDNEEHIYQCTTCKSKMAVSSKIHEDRVDPF